MNLPGAPALHAQFELLEWSPSHAVLFSAVCSERSPFFEQPGKSPAEMQIFVRSVDRTFAVNVSQDASLSEVKAAIEDIEFIPAGMTTVTIILRLYLQKN